MAKKKLKRVLMMTGVVILGLAITFFVGLQMMLRGFSKEIAKIEINNVELSNIADGSYVGEYNFNESVGAKVEVKVENRRITGVNILEHRNGMGSKAEAIINSVIDAQSLQVDAITGATGSSTVILKAIEDALDGK